MATNKYWRLLEKARSLGFDKTASKMRPNHDLTIVSTLLAELPKRDQETLIEEYLNNFLDVRMKQEALIDLREARDQVIREEFEEEFGSKNPYKFATWALDKAKTTGKRSPYVRIDNSRRNGELLSDERIKQICLTE